MEQKAIKFFKDLISETERVLADRPEKLREYETVLSYYHTAIKALQERPKGRWEQFMIFEHIKRCSECGCTVSGKPNFCPKCGADMRESE